MQILEPNEKQVHSYSNEEGHFIETFLLGTKPTNHETADPSDDFTINKEYGHKIAQTFDKKHFAIIPELIKERGRYGGGHFWAQSKDEILAGYQKHSHGIITKIKGPYPYNDGTDDYYYKANIKLAGSKAASVLINEGQKTWIPYATSCHLWTGDNHDIKNAEGLGIALVIKGAYGSDAVVTKLCKGSEQACDKSLGASILCEKEDSENAEIISSLVSKTASISTYMDNPNKEAPSNAAPQEAPKPNTIIETQKHVTESPSISQQSTVMISAEELETLKQAAKEVTVLRNKDKLNSINALLTKVKDEKARKEMTDELSKLDNKEVDLIVEKVAKLYPILKASEQEGEPKPEEEGGTKANKKGKAASITLPNEPKVEEEEQSKAASITVNEVAQLRSVLFGRRAN